MDRSKSINWLIRNCDSIRTFALWNYLSNYYGCTMLSSSCMDFNLFPWKKNCIFLYIYNLEENWKLKNIEIQSRYMNMLNTRMIETNKLKLYGRVDCIKTFFFFFLHIQTMRNNLHKLLPMRDRQTEKCAFHFSSRFYFFFSSLSSFCLYITA